MEFSPLQQKLLPNHPIPNKDLDVNNAMSTDSNAVDDSSSCTNTETIPKPPQPLQRLGSGASDVIDPPEPGGETESKKLPSSKYKGVVPQPNGRWGAQIYEKHNRVWLGTFGEEAEAAKAYDVAAQRFRGTDAVTNFAHLSNTNEADETELEFLRCHSKAEIVDMLRKHTYNDELRQSRNFPGVQPGFRRDFVGSEREHLFDKAVTPSDVGKLNRLVIPKQHAEKQFPMMFGKKETSKGVLLTFEDRTGKVWRFRYSYWNSSQSYVLTKGWSRFVKDKNLKAGDVVSFFRSVGADRKLWIEWTPRMGGDWCRTCRAIQLPVAQAPVVRLFGVDIAVGGVTPDASGKRRKEVEVWSWHGYKRQRPVVAENSSVGITFVLK